jgi:hypothetical protein
VKVAVKNSQPKYHILIDPNEFLPKLSLLKDEIMKLRGAIEAGRDYELPERHDPLYLMFDNDYLLGTATHWPEYLAYYMDTDEEEKMQEIKNAAVPYNTVGLVEVKWTPLGGPNEEDVGKELPEVAEEGDLIGKPWTYRLDILQASDLPVFCEMAYVEYEFMGETFTTEAVQQTTFSPKFDYSHVHHVAKANEDLLKMLKGAFEMRIHVTQHISAPPDKIGTSNSIVVESIVTGDPKGYASSGVAKPKTEAEVKNEQLTVALEVATEENAVLRQRVRELELTVTQLEGTATVNPPLSARIRAALESAKVTDSVVNE